MRKLIHSYFVESTSMSAPSRTSLDGPVAASALRGPARRIADIEGLNVVVNETGGWWEEYYQAEATELGMSFEQYVEHAWPLDRLPWIGGRGEQDDPDKAGHLEALRSGHLTAHSPPELLLIALMPKRWKLCGSSMMERVEQELELQRIHCQLLGKPVPGGRPPAPDCEEVCCAIAPDYLRKAIGLRQADKAQTLSAILKRHFDLVDTVDTKEQNDRRIRPYMRYFEKNRDRIMLRISDGKFEDEVQKSRFLSVLHGLRAVGLDVDIDFIDKHWHIL